MFPYIVPSSVLGKGNNVAPSKRITMGFIGVGGMGTNNMRAFLNQDDVQVVAVCDVVKAGRGRCLDGNLLSGLLRIITPGNINPTGT
jgi:hypothetical protein